MKIFEKGLFLGEIELDVWWVLTFYSNLIMPLPLLRCVVFTGLLLSAVFPLLNPSFEVCIFIKESKQNCFTIIMLLLRKLANIYADY